MSPADVNKTNDEEVRLNAYLVRTKTKIRRKVKDVMKKKGKPRKKQIFKFKVNDMNEDENSIWKIYKNLKRRRFKGEKQVLISWLHYPSKFNSWIKESDLKEV
ncbi:hypothetical protein KUTeg_006567 [Tegillarca granosa]|uniref:Chromo domain-containing protein n=1 Tax=Tegillarca granosa TaxID=220873 RepID=A0ABQ9FF16_TEGGR|nr:hypothetical protein KUTeg_006567 [Tegillarca granosa]